MDHPEKWPFCGYNEIQDPPTRYRIIDLGSLVALMGCTDLMHLQMNHKRWVQACLDENNTSRQTHWAESIATGSKSFVEKVKNNLGFRGKGKSISSDEQQYQLREEVAEFGNSRLKLFNFNTTATSESDYDNTFFWENWKKS